MGERMGGHDYLFIDERRETLKRSVCFPSEHSGHFGNFSKRQYQLQIA